MTPIAVSTHHHEMTPPLPKNSQRPRSGRPGGLAKRQESAQTPQGICDVLQAPDGPAACKAQQRRQPPHVDSNKATRQTTLNTGKEDCRITFFLLSPKMTARHVRTTFCIEYPCRDKPVPPGRLVRKRAGTHQLSKRPFALPRKSCFLVIHDEFRDGKTLRQRSTTTCISLNLIGAQRCCHLKAQCKQTAARDFVH